jgi:hypothetical protein
MPHGDDPINIEMPTFSLCGKHVECGVDVLKRPGISATGFIQSTIFNAPDGNALGTECGSDTSHLRHALILVLKATAVDQHHHWEWPGTTRLEQFNKLIRRVSIGQSFIRGGP